MASDFQLGMAARQIPNAFMDSSVDPDGIDENGAFIDCKVKFPGEDPLSVCIGFSSSSASASLAAMKYKLRGNTNQIITASYILGEIHWLALDKLYASDANGVVLYYAV